MDRYSGLEDFVRAQSSALSRTAYLLTGDHHLAQDLLQVALTKTAAHWHRIADGKPQAYVRRVMVNERASWWRRRKWVVEHPAEHVPERAGPDEAERIVRRLALVRALNQLGARQRAVLVFRFYEDLSEADTAEIMGCSVGTVKSQTHAALARLRAVAPELAELIHESKEVAV